MKFYETHFEEYINKNNKVTLHPKLKRLFKTVPSDVCHLQNMIFYGPPGIGKYTQILSVIQRYSPSKLKYEKKMCVTYGKNSYVFKISDIHFEVDMSLLGCNSKLLWNEIYNEITDAVLAKNEKIGIIMCKNFHQTHSELLEIFHSYIQINNNLIQLKFIFVTEQISFIPSNIIQRCEIISIPRATRSQHIKCFGTKIKRTTPLERIDNLKKLYDNTSLQRPKYENICNKIITIITSKKNINYAETRDLLYNLFIFNVDVYEAIWYITTELIKKNLIASADITDVLLQLWKRSFQFNNNYRPIYHLESILFYLIAKIHGLPLGPKNIETSNIILSEGT